MSETDFLKRYDDLIIRLGNGEDLNRLQPLWEGLYQHQQEHGMVLPVPEDGFQHWVNSLKNVLNRFACLFVVECGEEVIGFLAGRIRAIPNYFGGGNTGFISDVYIRDDYRSRGIGEKMVALSLTWFVAQKIDRVELQVITSNIKAREFYQRHGWREELVQMVWQTGQGTGDRDL